MPSGKQNTPNVMEKMVGRMMGRPAPYAERLQFAPPRGGTGDLDETQISQAMLDQVGEKMKDLVGKGKPAG